MKLKQSCGLLAAMLSLVCSTATAEAADYGQFYKNLPITLPAVTPPSIPSYEVSITTFGGVNDGITLNTEAFAKAMSHLSSKGGSRLVVPEGIWYTGPIH
ncbi:MAG: glycoside hydrolase family 28 protein, partial [Duncaniella sp.]|nr:glycoside hydrolase family 28 protein [Duncaniella sp.]